MAATTTMKLPPQYYLRPGRRSDLTPATHIYQAAFDPDMLPDILFPSRHEHPQDFLAFLSRLFDDRYWSPQWILTVICGSSGSGDGGGDDAPVGFTWWKRPLSELSIWERWLSPCTHIPILLPLCSFSIFRTIEVLLLPLSLCLAPFLLIFLPLHPLYSLNMTKPPSQCDSSPTLTAPTLAKPKRE